MDETYIRIKGRNAYLYRAVDSKGNSIDFYVSERRDKIAAKKFDKYPATEMAITRGEIFRRNEL